MGSSVVADVESGVVPMACPSAGTVPTLRLRMLGPLSISQDGQTLALPTSRKVRALIAYLALAARATTRAHLCELLWDVPNDPRGELRWCLSKARAVLDLPGRRRVEAGPGAVGLDLTDAWVDALEIDAAARAGFADLSHEKLRALAVLFEGEFLEGLEIEKSPQFSGWLKAQRRRLRSCHAALLEHLVEGLPVGSDEAIGHFEAWLRLAPFDRHAHAGLLHAFDHSGRPRDADAHLAALTRSFDAEGLDWRPIAVARRNGRPHAIADKPSTAMVSEVAPEVGRVILIPGAAPPTEGIGGPLRHRASIAVMPFVERPVQRHARGGLAGGLVHDIITRLAKLRSLFVIAQGTVFALDERNMGVGDAGRTLNVDYVVSGSLVRERSRLLVNVELIEARTARIVWTEDFDRATVDVLHMLDEIGNRIVASVASEIESVERNRAILKAPNSLDAWEAHHRGLWHVYRFNRADNALAQQFFEMAVRLDPTFSRAHAGLSFTHFQSAFQHWSDRTDAMHRAYETAAQSMLADDRDPAAHWAMGRALWLRGQQAESLIELGAAVDLSPNFALGYYTLAFVHSQAGDPQAAIEASDHSRQLSPFDPLLFGMLGSRAMALVRQGHFDEAADWAVKAAARPNAHVHIQAIAMQCLALAGRLDEARGVAAAIRAAAPSYGFEDFISAFRFEAEAVARYREAAGRIGFD